MQEPISIEFSHGVMAQAIYPSADTDLSVILAQLGLSSPRPVILIVGGASYLSDADRQRLRSLFLEVLAPLAESLNACVIDGGTDAGVMQMMGEARRTTEATFPLVGVTAVGLATLPHQPPPTEDACALEPNHSHFVMIPGSQWGDESPWMVALSRTVSGSYPAVTVLMNGGEITWKDAKQSVAAQQPIVVIAGSGRTADILVAALKGTVKDDQALALVESGLIQAVDLEDGEQLARVLQHLLTKNGASLAV